MTRHQRQCETTYHSNQGGPHQARYFATMRSFLHPDDKLMSVWKTGTKICVFTLTVRRTLSPTALVGAGEQTVHLPPGFGGHPVTAAEREAWMKTCHDTVAVMLAQARPDAPGFESVGCKSGVDIFKCVRLRMRRIAYCFRQFALYVTQGRYPWFTVQAHSRPRQHPRKP